ncbi:BMP-2-inducible protein kinase [Tritrichomonas musculus]|uniref:non-specific serine/threonine protein kinase n=1 Tax=Tritrichomonas musculus TaxID=1915356 RepID=A0ABR2IKQ0_9EUKA
MKKSKSKSDTKSEEQIEGTHYVINEYQVTAHAKIAGGSHSQVYTCLDQKSYVHAIKIIKIPNENVRNQVMNEISIHSQLCQEHILKLEGFHSSDKQYEILYEFCDTNLIEQMKHVIGKGFSTLKIAEIFTSVLSAVKYMHEQNPPIIYRDLSPQNVLCKKGTWKLCHFRYATNRVFYLNNDADRKQASEEIENNTNSVNRSPEMINLFLGDEIGTPSDIWALGCLLFNICTLTDPFPNGLLTQINGLNDYHWNQPWEVDEFYKDIVKKCLNKKPNERPTAAQLDEEFRTHFRVRKDAAPTQRESRRSQRLSQQISLEISQRNSEANLSEKNENFEHSYKHASKRPPNLPHSSSFHQLSNYNLPNIRRQQVHHIKLNYSSYTKALLNALPPETEKEELTDESDVEFIPESKEGVSQANISDNDLDDQIFNEIEQKHMAAHPANPQARRPSVINLGTTIESLIHGGESQPQSIFKAMNRFNEHGTIIDNTTNQMFDLKGRNTTLYESGAQNGSNLTLAGSSYKMHQNNQMRYYSAALLGKKSPQSNDEDDVSDGSNSSSENFKFTYQSSHPSDDYKSLYVSNPDKLKAELINLDDLPLSSALFNIMTSGDATEFILKLVRESGIKGSRLLSLIPVLPESPLNNYIEQRKNFIINFPMFEGNFSLYVFTLINLSKGVQIDPGEPPISVDVANGLIDLSRVYLKSLKLNKSSKVLGDDGKDLFQIFAYIIAKLKIFDVRPDLVDEQIIPSFRHFQKKILKQFSKAGTKPGIYEKEINFDDKEELEKIKPPEHIDIYEQQ